MKRIFSLVLIFALCLPLTACGLKTKYTKTVMNCFDTVTTIVGYAMNEKTFLTVADEIEAELWEYHALFSIYDDADVNNLKLLNEKRSIKASKKLMDFLEYGISMYEKTQGRMNIAMGAVLSLWHEARTAGIKDPVNSALPDMAALFEASKHCDITSISIDRENGIVSLTDEKTLLDVGAIGKGYAVEMIAQNLEARGISGYLINAGGNVRTVGSRGDGEKWSIGVENPDGDEFLATLSLSGEALITSGSYMRYYFVNGKKYHHIISPDTLMPSDGIVSLTVLSKSSAEGDALSTALFTLSYEDGVRLLENFPEVEALWLLSDGRKLMTDGFEAFISS